MNSGPDSDTLEDEHLNHFAQFKNTIDPLVNSSSEDESDIDDEDDIEEDEIDDFENEYQALKNENEHTPINEGRGLRRSRRNF